MSLVVFGATGGDTQIDGGFDQQTFYLQGHSAGDEGHAGTHGAGHTSGAGAAHASMGASEPKPLPNPHWTVCTSDNCTALEPAEAGAPPKPGPTKTPAPPSTPGAPPTPGLSDVEHFLVGAPTARSEPNGWTVAGLETNFIASAGESEQSGTLLGQPVTVHFTPVAYDWRYGDGSGKRVTTAGATWQAYGLSNFAKTPTSHAYDARGTYTATVTVEYSARYRYAGQGWANIAGTLGLTSDPIVVQVKGVKTVLVGQTCDENPSGPGC